MAGENESSGTAELNDKLYRTSVFVGKMLLAGLVFQLVLYLNPSTYQVQIAFASLIGSLLDFAGVEVTTTGIRIFTAGAVYVIVQDCLGWKSLAVFLGLMYASTERTLEHLSFILLGLWTLVVANIIRVFTTVYLAEIGVINFEVIHGVLWRWSLTLIVLGLWIYWFKDLREQNKFEERIKDQVRSVGSK